MSVNDILNQIEQSHIEEALRSIDDGFEHHFADSTTYDVLYEGRRYPPKAVVGVAAYHAKQVVLTPSDFKGGLKSKCFRVLESHSFEIVPKNEDVSEFPFVLGQEYSRRDDLHANYGGGHQSGISSSSTHDIVFLFTGSSGEQYGYEDEWTEDGCFLYTGAGQKGDMVMKRGNKAIRDHIENGKELHVFESLGKGQPYRYRGRFVYESHSTPSGLDVDGNTRQLIVFRLKPYRIADDFSDIDQAIDDTEVAAGKPRKSGQGFRLDVKARLALEAYSMNTARAHYEARGWVVTDVSGNHPYDFHCTKEGEVDRRVEVKGTTTAGASVLLTANEVAHAKEYYPHVDLFIVHSIVLTYETGQEPITSGGVIQKLSPWQIQDENLKAISYQYTV